MDINKIAKLNRRLRHKRAADGIGNPSATAPVTSGTTSLPSAKGGGIGQTLTNGGVNAMSASQSMPMNSISRHAMNGVGGLSALFGKLVGGM